MKEFGYMIKTSDNNVMIKHTKKDLMLLIVIGGLFSLGVFLSNTFVNVFLWRQTNDYLTIAIYNVTIFIFQPIAFIIAGRVSKTVDRIIVLRLGIIFLCLFYITVLILNEKAAYYNIILGCLLGIGYGFYWLAFNVLTFEITEPKTRDFFNGLIGALESFAGMTGPLIAGILIAKLTTNIGYTTIFSISLSLFLLAVTCSMFLQRRKATGKYELTEVYRELRLNQNWKHINYANLFFGIREGTFVFVITIWVFLITQSEFALGIFHLVLNGVSLVGYIVIGKVITSNIKKQAIFIGCFLASIAIYLFSIQFSYVIVILYAFTVGIAYPLLNIPYNSLTYDVIGVSKNAKDWRIEYVVIFECFINIGRIVSVILFIALYLIFDERMITYLLFIISPSLLFVYYYMKKITI